MKQEIQTVTIVVKWRKLLGSGAAQWWVSFCFQFGCSLCGFSQKHEIRLIVESELSVGAMDGDLSLWAPAKVASVW